MAAYPPRLARSLAAFGLLVLAGPNGVFAAEGSVAVAGTSGCTEPVRIKSDTFGADYRQNNVDLHNVDISQCDVRVRAKNARAKGLNTENGHWNFDGDVRIDVENRGNLRANEAQVEFRDNQISKLNITGTPAE